MIGMRFFGDRRGKKCFKITAFHRLSAVTMGLILEACFKIIPPQAVESLSRLICCAGIIGFLVGGELKKEIFVRIRRASPIVLLFEAYNAFCPCAGL
jgi:hypothetical protein